MSGQDYIQLDLFQEASLASLSVSPGSEEAVKMTVTSGRKCLELSRSCGPLGSLGKMLLESSTWRSTRCFLTWKVKATPSRRLLFRLVPSMPRTEETGSPLWPTITRFDADCGDLKGKEFTGTRHAMKLIQAAKLWPTPTARDCKGSNSMEHLTREGTRNHTDQLANCVKMWPTPSASDCGRTAINPVMTKNGTVRHLGKSGGQSYARLDAVAALFPTVTARDYKSPDTNQDSKRFSKKTELPSVVGGQLNPTWVEWLMGFPIGWTDLNA